MRKIVFLDIDGVLNSNAFLREQNKKGLLAGLITGTEHYFCPEMVALFNEIIRRTGAEVVISSSWRRMMPVETLHGILRKAGVEGAFVDVTPALMSGDRADEIGRWLAMNEYEDRWVAIDDDYSVRDMERAVAVDDGLQPAHVELACEILERECTKENEDDQESE